MSSDDLTLEIRRVHRTELAQVAAIHVASWRAAYRGVIPVEILAGLSVEERRSVWERWIEAPGSELWAAFLGTRMQGFARLQPAPASEALPPDFGEVTHLYLDPVAYGTGVGRPLFRRVVASAREVPFAGLSLWVLEENPRARRFYEREGFEADGARQTRPEWLGEGVYEVRYRLPFGSAWTKHTESG